MLVFNTRQQKIIHLLIEKGSMQSSDIHAELDKRGEKVSLVTIKRDISELRSFGAVLASGSGRSTSYAVSINGDNITSMNISDSQKKDIAFVARKYALRLLVLFGSQARGEAHKESDIDIAYSAAKAMDMTEENRMALELGSIFGTSKLDFVNLLNSNPLLLKRIVSEGIVLYEAEESFFNNLYLYAMNVYRESKIIQELRQYLVMRRNEQFKKDIAYAG